MIRKVRGEHPPLIFDEASTVPLGVVPPIPRPRLVEEIFIGNLVTKVLKILEEAPKGEWIDIYDVEGKFRAYFPWDGGEELFMNIISMLEQRGDVVIKKEGERLFIRKR